MKYISPLNSRHNFFSGIPFGDLESQINALFGVVPPSSEGGGKRASEPSALHVDWYENDASFVVRMDLPGVKRSDVELETNDGAVALKAKRIFRGAAEGDERTFEYTKSILVPEGVDHEQIAASHEDGVLSIEFPKAEKVKPRKIDVKFDN